MLQYSMSHLNLNVIQGKTRGGFQFVYITRKKLNISIELLSHIRLLNIIINFLHHNNINYSFILIVILLNKLYMIERYENIITTK